MKKILIILLSGILVFSNTSCDSYLDVNENVDAPISIDAHLYLPGICASLQGIYYEIRALGPLTQMMGTTSYTSYANHSFSVASDAAGEMWRVVYWLHGMNLENMINQSLDAGDYALAGIGLTIKAFDWDMLVKYHGEVPFRQAFEQDRFSHEYDYQKDVYPEIRKMAYKAIEYIEMEEADMSKYGTFISGNDYIYQGNISRWKKFAYAVLARNYISLSNKTDFVSSGFADSVIYCVNNSFASSADDATLQVAGDGTTTNTSYMNFWGVSRKNLMNSTSYYYFQHEYAVQILSGTVPKYNEANGNKQVTSTAIGTTEYRRWYPYELSEVQIITDTVRSEPGHFDPRITLLCATQDMRYAQLTENNKCIVTIAIPDGSGGYTYVDRNPVIIDTFPNEISYVKDYLSKRYIGGNRNARTGSYSVAALSADGRSATRYAPSFYGRDLATNNSVALDGYGRWLYRDGAPYILSTCAEMKFCAAEAYWKKGDKAGALHALQDGIARHIDFCAKYIALPNDTDAGGDKVSAATFRTLANEYLVGPYVGGLTAGDLTLSHIMMQKWVSLYPWGAHEAWVDMRKYHYDVNYTGDYPKNGNGWEQNSVEQKWDTDDTKVYKGFYLYPANVQHRQAPYSADNQGSPCYRIRPRYNSEYMWNLPSLEALKPIPGNALNYHCSIPWFAFPGDVPESL
ncbi:MAG: SusD/RagB family nutrient-binding outer membrane lipoprotein [Prevotellaceae bacterium]|jgi:hypothetical protein|nr:SusD/RagB family nutrient-binding outer membrane lipoprotein [Prevotellaceae bacterium]